MRSYKNKLLFFLVLFVGSILSCEESPEGIQSTLFGSDIEDTFGRQDLTFTYSQQFESTANGYINWGETIGFDITVNNFSNELPVTNVSVQINNFSTSSYISNYDSEASSINFIGAFSSGRPDYTWCVDFEQSLLVSCTQPNDGYVGHFYFNTSSSFSGAQEITLFIRVTYTYDGSFYEQTYERDFFIFD